MDTIFDDNFSHIQGLKWLPWIGEEYFSIPKEKRLLIVGESHYHDKTKKSIKSHNAITFTREVIEEMAIDRCYGGTKIFQNLHKVLFRNDEFDTYKFWSIVAFYNFIQRPMVTNYGRPTFDDNKTGWKVFAGLVEILKPTLCLFVGTSSANYLDYSLAGTNFKSSGVIREDWISNSFAKSCSITHKDGETVELIFIRHCSAMFNCDKWNKYLEKKMNKQMLWLDKQTKN